MPNPIQAQKYRIPAIWRGDQGSEMGKAMMSCKQDGGVAIMITNITIDPHAGPVATGRMFAGTVTKGTKINLVNAAKEAVVQQVALYMGAERVNVERVTAGNMVALSGLRDAYAGETVSTEKIESFEAMKHYSEPVMTKSIEAKNTADLPKLIEILRQVAKEDPNIRIEINEETGEHLISGMGELHLEVVEGRIKTERGLEVETSQPIVVYRETVSKLSPKAEGKSPNRHNRFYVTVEPLPDAIYDLMIEGKITQQMIKKQTKEVSKLLQEAGMEKDEAKKPWSCYNNNLMIDVTKGIQYLNETEELLVQGFEEAMNRGPLAQEKVGKILVKLHDAKLHEDAIHRGPSQVLPAIRRPIYAAMLQAGACLLEPKQKVVINVPQDMMGSVSKEMQGRRGQILEIEQDEDAIILTCKSPLAEMFGFAGDIRSATQGKALWSTEYMGYERLPGELQDKVVRQIRERKGLEPEPKPASYYMEP